MKWYEIYTREEVSTNRMKSFGAFLTKDRQKTLKKPSTSGRGMASTGFTNLDYKASGPYQASLTKSFKLL